MNGSNLLSLIHTAVLRRGHVLALSMSSFLLLNTKVQLNTGTGRDLHHNAARLSLCNLLFIIQGLCSFMLLLFLPKFSDKLFTI